MTFSFKPWRWSTLPLIAASVNTFVVSWKEAEEEKEEKEIFEEEDKDIVLPEADLEDDNMIKFTDLFDDDSEEENEPSLENKD